MWARRPRARVGRLHGCAALPRPSAFRVRLSPASADRRSLIRPAFGRPRWGRPRARRGTRRTVPEVRMGSLGGIRAGVIFFRWETRNRGFRRKEESAYAFLEECASYPKVVVLSERRFRKTGFSPREDESGRPGPGHVGFSSRSRGRKTVSRHSLLLGRSSEGERSNLRQRREKGGSRSRVNPNAGCFAGKPSFADQIVFTNSNNRPW